MTRICNPRLLLLVIFLALSCLVEFGQQSGSNASRKVLNRVTPAYPPLARRTNVTGIVKIDVLVAPDGTVQATEVLGGNPILAQAAMEALRKWKFEPSAEQSRERIELKFKPQ